MNFERMVERIERVCTERVIEKKKEFAQGEKIPKKSSRAISFKIIRCPQKELQSDFYKLSSSSILALLFLIS